MTFSPVTQPWGLPPEKRTPTKTIELACGYVVGDDNYFEPDHPVYWEAHTWDCPSCGSLLLAIAMTSLASTRDNDPVKCPVCGDMSAFIHSSHYPSVECLIEGSERLTEAQCYKDES